MKLSGNTSLSFTATVNNLVPLGNFFQEQAPVLMQSVLA